MSKKNILRVLFGIILLTFICWVVKAQFNNFRQFTPDLISGYLETFGKKAAIVYILAYAFNTILPFPPLAILSLTAGLAFGKLWGAIYLMIGAMLGASVAFFLSRFLAKDIIEKALKGRIKDFDDAMKTKGFVTILFFRLIPIIPHEVLNYASGLTKISFRDYFFATLIGVIPGIIISANFGGELGKVDSIRELISFKFVITAIVIISVILTPVIYKLLSRKKRDGKA
jgi:uncharacterized membrane protein YdjX (TVP38/TMEM64 family)